jgi:hypothetical protein
MNSVQEKMTMMAPPVRKNDTTTKKQLGKSNGEIRYLGRSNQKIRRRLR